MEPNIINKWVINGRILQQYLFFTSLSSNGLLLGDFFIMYLRYSTLEKSFNAAVFSLPSERYILKRDAGFGSNTVGFTGEDVYHACQKPTLLTFISYLKKRDRPHNKSPSFFWLLHVSRSKLYRLCIWKSNSSTFGLICVILVGDKYVTF